MQRVFKLSKLKILLLSATGFEMKREMSQADTTGQSSNIPEPALDWEGKDPGLTVLITTTDMIRLPVKQIQ